MKVTSLAIMPLLALACGLLSQPVMAEVSIDVLVRSRPSSAPPALADSGVGDSLTDDPAKEYQGVSEHSPDRDPLTQLRSKAAKPSPQPEDDFRLLIRL